MIKAYKIQIDPYEIKYQIEKNGELEDKTKMVIMKYELPRHLCNGAIGGEGQKPAKDFDLMEIGPIAQRIEQCADIQVTVNQHELDVLKKRVNVIGKSGGFGFNYFEMFRRVLEAQPVDLVEEVK